ncbi:g8261 [Coccomyxa viridis]|uniref:G8261 protein n=1 Tax=Coccomyxa viridis TaxID=1274662 RepID=A0ABP1FZX7_9CHLO
MKGAHSKVALVTGASGIQGLSLLKAFSKQDDWSAIYAVARSDIPLSSKTHKLALDLDDKEALRKSLEGDIGRSVTHVFHLAFSGDTTNVDQTTFVWMKNVVEILEELEAPLVHVYFTQGQKYYGVHMGNWDIADVPWKDEPLTGNRHLSANFYYAQEDWAIERRSQGAKWTWSALRPGAILGYSLGSMNMVNLIAVYGTLCKERNVAFRFPGAPQSFNCLFDSTDADLISECVLWLIDTPTAQDNAYNISNGDVFRFSQIWPGLAQWFGLKTGMPRQLPLRDFFPAQEALWKQTQKKHSLKDTKLEKLTNPPFADFAFNLPLDSFADVTKLRKAGFNGQKLWTEENYIRYLDELATRNIIPNYPKLRGEAKASS